MKLVLMGPPGAGKGTQAANLSQEFQIPAISTGHIIRKAIRENTPLGQVAKEYIERGELVPDDIAVSMINERLKQDDCKNGFILDGFPRTVRQAQILDETEFKIFRVINLEVPDEVLVDRLSGRRECKTCGATYHTQFNPPAEDNICDTCGEQLIRREDDVPEVIIKRLGVYHEQTEPLKEYYQRQNKLYTVMGQDKVENTTALVMQAVAEK